MQILVSAVDLDQEPLQYSVAGLPAAATITPGPVYGTAAIQWTPQASDIGTYNVTVSVQDGGNGGVAAPASDLASFQINVRSANASPSLQPISNQLIDEFETLSLVAVGADPDGDVLSYRGENLPVGAVVNPDTGLFNWTPSFQQAGTYENVRIIASDGHRSRFQEFDIFVTNVNRGPILVPREPLFMREGGVLEFTMEAGDIDGDALKYSASNLPAGADFTEDGRFTWNPGYEQAGTYVIGVTVSDPSGLTDSGDVTLRIDNINRAPLLSTSYHAVRLGSELRFSIEAVDPDLGTTLVYHATDLPEGATVNPTTGEIVWTPGPAQDREYLIRVFASDGQATSSQIVVVLAAVDLPKPDVSVVLTPSFPSPAGTPILVQAVADSLADIANLTVSFNGTPVQIDAEGRGVIKASAPGRFEVVATATDVDGLVGVATTTLKVRNPNDSDIPIVDLVPPNLAMVTDGIIRGTVQDLNLDEWTLELKRIGDAQYRTIASGHDSIVGGVLATLDVQDMPNDLYVLRLSARDVARRLARVESIIEVYSDTKRNFVLSQTDLVATVGGVSVEVTRLYDSVERDRTDRAGFGWQLVGRDINLRASVQPTRYESQGLHSAYRDQTRLYLLSPDGDELGFTFDPIEQSFPGLTYYESSWQPFPANPVGWLLESPGLHLMRGGGQYFELSSGYPYNPLSPLFGGNDFILTAPDGTRYEIDARIGITSRTDPSGSTVYVGDSGFVATGGESIRFITDGEGRLRSLIGPNSEIINYHYDSSGNLVAVRDPQSGSTTRYGYSSEVDHRLEMVVGAAGTGSTVEYSDILLPTVSPVLANLGAPATFAGNSVTAPLSAGESKYFAFSIRESEIDSTSTGEVLIRVVARTSGGIEPNLPSIRGLVPRTTAITSDRAEGIFAMAKEGLYLVEVSGAAGVPGDVELEISVAGDINEDGLIDGFDSDLQAGLTGRIAGQPGFLPSADLDGSGTIDQFDRQLLFRNAGFVANVAPVANPEFGRQLTHTDLGVRFALDDAVLDPDGDAVYYQIVAAQNGTASLGSDGRTVTFVPEAGYFGVAEISLRADDGFNQSDIVSIGIDVSNAALLGIDIVNRLPSLEMNDRVALQVIGQFADQSDVPLIGSYVTYSSSQGSVATVDGDGNMLGIAEGFTAVVVSRGVHQAATAVTVGAPGANDPTYEGDDIFVYPSSLTLPRTGGQRQFRVETLAGRDLSQASQGTLYVLGDSRIIDITSDGFATSASLGMTTVTIINGGGEEVIPVRVIEPQVGVAAMGADGGILQNSEGVVLQIPPGALAEAVTVSMSSFVDTVAPEFDAVFDVGVSFTLDLGGVTLQETAQVAVPVPASFSPGETVYFFQRQSITLADGTAEDVWLVMETGVVGADGIARTTSPPYPGFSAGGRYRLAKADQPNRLVSLGFGAPPHAGVSIGIVSGGYGIPLGLGFLPIPYTLDFGISFLVYSRNPNEIPYAVQTQNYVLPPAGSVGHVVTVDLPTPNPSLSKPIIEDLTFVALGDSARVHIVGKKLLNTQVEIRQLDQRVTVVPAAGSSDTVIVVDIPAGYITGLTSFRVKHAQYGSSDIAYLRPTGGLGAVASTGVGATLFQTDIDTNQLVRKFSLGGGFDTVFTPDLTRAYVTTRNEVAVIDTMAIRQADADLSTGAIDSIPIPGFVHQIAVDPLGHFVFVAGNAPTVWVIDIRPSSSKFNQVLRTIDLPRSRPTIGGLAVTSDGKHLLVGTGTDYDKGFMSIFKLDASNEPWPGNLAPGQWGMPEHDVALPGIPQAISVSSDPQNPGHVAFTYRYRVTMTSPYSSSIQSNLQRIGLMKLGGGTPTVSSVITKIQGGNLQSFATPFYSGYYTNILTPRDVVLSSDLSYAFIADWELHLVFGYGGQYGDKVGVIRDPFNLQGQQKYLGATTPVDFGLTTSVALQGETRLFAAYGDVGEVLVMDVQQLIAAGESLAGNPIKAERTPLDQVAGFNVHITPLTVGGLLQGLSTQKTPTLRVRDASGDDSRETVFQDGAIRVGYELAGGGAGATVTLQLLLNGSVVRTLGTFAEAIVENKLINLAELSPALAAGVYQVRARISGASGTRDSNLVELNVLPSNIKKAGTFVADTFNYVGANNSGTVYFGNGGTDTINLGVPKSAVKSLNGDSLDSYNPATNTGLAIDSQAIYRGSSFDFLRLSDGREIYFQGIERIQFTDGTISLQVLPNDPLFPRQWNLTVTDTADAWRYTKGSNDVLLVSLDSGLPTAANAAIDDLSVGRTVYGLSVPDGDVSDQHGHQAISIFSAVANNGYRIAGINWNSTVRVEDLYDGLKFNLFGVEIYEFKTDLVDAINNAISYANTHNKKRIVFQGGIQGESWLTSGGTLAELQALFTSIVDTSFFAVAAGNGNQSVATPNPADLVQSGGVVRLEGVLNNVMAVGAAIAGNVSAFTTTLANIVQINLSDPAATMIDNATSIDRASYSNFGPNLTLMAPTDSPATQSAGTVTLNPGGGNAYAFNGTSAANPNMAGYASLVWSVNPDITAGDLRNILIDTATDLGTAGLDNLFGYGLINTSAAVRRAYALIADKELAELYTANASLASTFGPLPKGPLNPSPYAPPPSFANELVSFVGPVELGNNVALPSDRQAESVHAPDDAPLSYEQLNSMVDEAQRRWASMVGAEAIAGVLANTAFTIGDLPETMLAATMARADSAWHVVIDANAASTGWFVDSTPSDDHEFSDVGSLGISRDAIDVSAAGRLDLLSVVMHELGHILALPDVEDESLTPSLMSSELDKGTRLILSFDDPVWDLVGTQWQINPLPTEDAIYALHLVAPREIVNGDFDVANPQDASFGWQTLGDAVVVSGAGQLREHELFNSRFSQSIEIPAAATSLRFSVNASFSADESNVSDAFEFALIDAHTGLPVLGSAEGIGATDASVNIQSDGTTFIANGVTVAGLAVSGNALDLGQSHTFVIDLTGLSEDRVVTLYFDLLGFGSFGSVVTIDQVALDQVGTPLLSMRLDPAFDSGKVGDGVTRFGSVDLIGTGESGQSVLLDIDGDGFDDGSTVVESNGTFRFAGLNLIEGVNAIRVAATNGEGTTVRSVSIEFDSQPPAAVLAAPIPDQLTASDLGYVEVNWNDTGSKGIDLDSIDVSDLDITGVDVDRVEFISGNRVRYWYNDDGDSLGQGLVEVVIASNAVADVAGNFNAGSQHAFTLDSLGATGTLVNPTPLGSTNSDTGYVDVQWTDRGLAGLDATSFGTDDVTVSGVDIDRVEDLGGGKVRYWYNDDGDSLAQGLVDVGIVPASVKDLAGNVNAGSQHAFTLDSLGATGTLVNPTPLRSTTSDTGYVDVQWADRGLAGLDSTSFGTDDVTVSGVDIDRVEDLGGGKVRYWYNDDGDILAEGGVTVAAVGGAVSDNLANPSLGFTTSFTFIGSSDEPVDISASVKVNLYGLQYNSRTGVYGFYASITNNSDAPLAYPLRLVLADLVAGTEVINPLGVPGWDSIPRIVGFR